VYFETDGSNYKCSTTCVGLHYLHTTLECVSNCNDSGTNASPGYTVFKEDGNDSLSVCQDDACSSDTRFKRIGSENICTTNCDTLSSTEGTGTSIYYFEAENDANASGMIECLTICPGTKAFIPVGQDFGLKSTLPTKPDDHYDSSDYTTMKCFATCPTSTTGTSNLAPKYLVTNDNDSSYY
jgi:hypothetical protein